MSMQQVVAAVRAQYGSPLTPEEAFKVCNEAAWVGNGKTADGRYGVYRKPPGAATQWQGYACDIIVDRDPMIVGYDCLHDWEGAGDAQWNVADVPSGGWNWQPVRLDLLPGHPEPPPPIDPPPIDPPPIDPPPIDPPPVEPPDACCERMVAKLTVLSDKVDTLIAEIEAVKRMAVQIGSDLQTKGVKVRWW